MLKKRIIVPEKVKTLPPRKVRPRPKADSSGSNEPKK
jgi:hypothetical protein